MSDQVEFLLTERFRRSYERYNGERARIRSKIFEISRKAEADPNSWRRNMERLHDPALEIYRFKVTEGDRLIFAIVDKKVILIDVGQHEIMKDFLELSNRTKTGIISQVQPIPNWYLKYSFPPAENRTTSLTQNEGEDEMRWLFEEELSESWLQYLDDEQYEVRSTILDTIKNPGEFRFHLILGGAGTGKTVVLLNLALSLRELGRNVVTRFSAQVLKYLNSGAQRVPGSTFSIQPGSVVLLDDPGELAELKRMIQECLRVGARGLVVALDPFQWLERRVYEKFNDLIESLEPERHYLTSCYRQSSIVGSKALTFTSNILDKTSPFILDSKIEEHKKGIDPLREICIESVNFVDSGGRFRVFQSNLEENFAKEIKRIRERVDLWQHWHPLLVVDDVDGFPLPKPWKDLLRNSNSIVKHVEDVSSIRGCEYQEVILLVGARTWNQIVNGVLGATSADWQRIISFHTLMTRPKDSLSIFVSNT